VTQLVSVLAMSSVAAQTLSLKRFFFIRLLF